MTPPSSPPLSRLLPWLVLGGVLHTLSGWEPNVLLATWLLPVFLLRFGRQVRAVWMVPALMLPALTASGLFTVRGAWHMGWTTEIFFSVVMALPLVVSVLADRLLAQRLPHSLHALIFPSVWVLFDYLYSFIYGLGDVFSPALTQFHLAPLRQLAAITGIYGITFLIGWFASVANTIWAHPDDLAVWKRSAMAFGAAFLVVFGYGSARITGFDHDSPTVRVASIVVPHPSDYHGEIVDRGTPSDEMSRWTDELAALEDRVFEQSARAADGGAQIIFWSETQVVLYKEHEPAYLERARAFAVEHGVYLQTAALVLRPDEPMIENQITLFTPQGDVGYSYLKSQTWYPTESDGVIRAYDTPYGRISSVICFDLDMPSWMRQAAALEVDLLLVPGFDTRAISPYHTEIGLFRAVEGGYSLIRGANDGTSMAVDHTGRTLALQDSFRTREPILTVDMPTTRHPTVYGRLGDWFVLVDLLGLLGLLGLARRR